jgi:hypothetical protein
MEPFGAWIYLCSTRKRRWVKTSRDNFELKIHKDSHPQSKLLGSFWLPQSEVRDSQQEYALPALFPCFSSFLAHALCNTACSYQQPFSMTIECVDGVHDVLVADDADVFSALLSAIKVRGRTFHSVPSGGYAHHRHELMIKDSWTLCWAVIEDQFLTLWKSKTDADASAHSSGVGGMGGDVQPLLVLPLMCATVIQCTDNVTVSIDLHQCGQVVSTHFLYLSSAAACSAWMSGFLKAVGAKRENGSDSSAPALASQTITTLALNLPPPHQLVTPEPGGMAIAAGMPIVPKTPKVLPDTVYGSAEQRAAAALPPEPPKANWNPLPAPEFSKLTAALGNPLEAISSRISASLSWIKGQSQSGAAVDAAAGGAAASAHVLSAASLHSAATDAASAAPESSASSHRSGPMSQSLQSVQSLRHRQPSAAAGTPGPAAAAAAADVEPAVQPMDSPPQSSSNSGLLSSLPLPECSNPPLPSPAASSRDFVRPVFLPWQCACLQLGC